MVRMIASPCVKGPDLLKTSLHCRSRKAKCDLGDLDAPVSPPGMGESNG